MGEEDEGDISVPSTADTSKKADNNLPSLRSQRGKHQRSSKRASKACLECRRRKARCDNEKPKCTACVVLGKECTMPDLDMRKISSAKRKKTTSPAPEASGSITNPPLMHNTSQSSSNAVLPPSEDNAVHNLFSLGDDLLGSSNQPTNIHQLPTLSTLSPTHDDDQSRPQQYDHHMAETAAVVAHDIQQAPMEGIFTPAGDYGQSLAAQMAGVSGRVSWAAGGQLRYYGPTSNRHLVHGGISAPRDTSSQQLNSLSIQALMKAGEGQPTNSEMEKRLLSLYFIWHNSFFYIVHQESFMRAYRTCLIDQQDTPFFSWTLYYAILAYSAPFLDEAVSAGAGGPEVSGDSFMRKARICLDVEMDNPRETTVQALAIMGSREVCVGRDARGYLYHGMAMSCAIDLGLHKDSTAWLEKGRLTLQHYHMRNVAWWGIYIYDRGWSVYVGRLPNGNRDISCPHPHSTGDAALSFSGSLVSLLRITDTILEELYSGQLFHKPNRSVAFDCHERLLAWKKGLPESEELDLDLQPSPSAPVLLLHLQFYATMLLLHRPFLADTMSNAFSVCCSATTSMATLLKLYRRIYTFRRIASVSVHQVFTAATTLVYIIHKQENPDDPNASQIAKDNLLTCLGVLSALAIRHVHARGSYLSVIQLMKKWRVSLNSISQGAPAVAPPAQNLTVPSRMFEAFSQELFDMVGTNTSADPVDLDTLLLQAADWNLPSNTDVAYSQSSAFNTASSLAPAGSSLSAMELPMPVLDFFDVNTEDNGVQSTEWSSWNGPSWLDIFDMENSAPTMQIGTHSQQQRGQQ